jgi:hypothetical protein
MGDPVTMAMIGASAGALLNKDDPLKGAMLGAAGGYGGATMLGGSAMLGGGAAAGMPGVGAAGSVAPGAFGAPAANVTAAGVAPSMSTIFANPTSALGGATQNFVSGPSTGRIASSLYQPTFMEKVTGGLDSIGQYAQQNPVLTQMALQNAQSLLQQQPQQPLPPNLMRGNPMPVQESKYQIGVPQISLI